MKIIEVDFKKKERIFTYDDGRHTNIQMLEDCIKAATKLVVLTTRSKKYQNDVVIVFHRILSDIKAGK